LAQTRSSAARTANAVAGDLLDGGDEFVVVDAAVIGPDDGAELLAAVLRLQRLHLLGAMRGEPVLQIDRRERRRDLAQVGRRRADARA
jgi:hypothetical protein